jgi:hypothetical protein
MKKRLGFVSNSSSSSFILAFKEKPETIEDLRLLLFPDNELNETYHESDYSWYPEAQRYLRITIGEALSCLLRDLLEERGTRNLKAVEQLFSCGWSGDHDMDQEAKEFLEKHADCKIYSVGYSDEDGRFYSAMEHEGLFNNLGSHVYTISQH